MLPEVLELTRDMHTGAMGAGDMIQDLARRVIPGETPLMNKARRLNQYCCDGLASRVLTKANKTARPLTTDPDIEEDFDTDKFSHVDKAVL